MSKSNTSKYLQNKNFHTLILSVLSLQPGEICYISHGNADSINKNVMELLGLTEFNLKICEDANHPTPTHKKPLRIRKAIRMLEIEDNHIPIYQFKFNKFLLEGGF